jgi:hypothetical protein
LQGQRESQKLEGWEKSQARRQKEATGQQKEATDQEANPQRRERVDNAKYVYVR